MMGFHNVMARFERMLERAERLVRGLTPRGRRLALFGGAVLLMILLSLIF
jgi:type II secretory pathway component PulM